MQLRLPVVPMVALLGGLGSIGCSGDPDASAAAGSGAGAGAGASAPVFHRDVEPLLQKSCQTCHAPGRIAPFGLMSYADAQAVAGLMATRTHDRTMPPWGAQDTDACTGRFGWKDDRRLSQAEIDLFEAWSSAGAPEGDPADAPPPALLGDDELPGVQAKVTPKTAYVASGEADQFRCFVLDPQITETKYLNGFHFVAGDPKVVHHALVFLDEQNESAALADADGGYDCFGGPGISQTALIGAWAPGSVPNIYPPNAGMPIAPGSRMVMQVHYHPAGTTGKPDATEFQMRFTDAKPEYQVRLDLIGNFDGPVGGGDGLLPGPNDPGSPAFVIPHDTKDHTETMLYTIPGGTPGPDILMYGVGAHMHYVGTDMKIEIERASTPSGDPKSECLLETPHWDFNWQRAYYYDTDLASLPQAHAGDVLRLTCTYDNTLQNPFVMRALTEQKLAATQDIHLGETTLDEMCLGVFVALLPLGG